MLVGIVGLKKCPIKNACHNIIKPGDVIKLLVVSSQFRSWSQKIDA